MLAIAVTVSFCQCGKNADDGDGYGSEYPKTNETFDIIDSCMSFMETAPDKSHQIIDSVRNAGLMSPQRCDYYHATVVFEGNLKPDSALAICNKLLDDGNFGDDKYLEEEICELASNITLSCDRFVETLKYANRGIAICHGQELMGNDEATLMGRAGYAQQMLGRTKEAKETYAKANDLLKEDDTFGGLIARFSLMIKQESLFSDEKEYDKAIAVCQELLSITERFDRDPSFVTQRPQTMTKPGDATREFADFYETQMYCKIAGAYRQKIEQGLSANAAADRDSASKYMDKWCKTTSRKSPYNQASAMRELLFCGRKVEFDDAKLPVAEFLKGDSLVKDYVNFLSVLAEDAAESHDYMASSDYLRRALAVSDSIRQHEMLRTLSEQMSINMVQEQQLARQEAELTASRHKLLNWLLTILLLTATMASVVIYRLKRRDKNKEEIIQNTQNELKDTKVEVEELKQQLEEAKAERLYKNALLMYDRINEVMREKQLYLNSDLDVRLLAEELCSSRTFISLCINRITGKTFRQWLSEYRLSVFIQRRDEHPNESIETSIGYCGYKDQSTFRRQFKATYGMTPSEYVRKDQ